MFIDNRVEKPKTVAARFFPFSIYWSHPFGGCCGRNCLKCCPIHQLHAKVGSAPIAANKVFTIQQESDKNDFIIYCAALIKEDFADTLFTMCCETALADGSWKDSYGETLATIGIALQLSTEDIKMIIRTYIIRNRWNIKVEQ